MTIVTCASPAARSVEGTEKDSGQMIMQLMLWKYKICFVVSAVRSDRLYAHNIKGSSMKIAAFMTQMSTYTIPTSFFV